MKTISRTCRADMARMLAAGACTVCLLILPGSAPAQALNADSGDIEGAISTLTTQDAALYIRPVTNGLGAGMNTAWFSTAGSHGLGAQRHLPVSSGTQKVSGGHSPSQAA